MAGGLDARARKTAKRLVNNYGRSLVYRRKSSGGAYVPASGTRSATVWSETEVTGLVVEDDSDEAGDDTTARLRAVLVTIPASLLSFTPREGDEIKDPNDGDRIYRVVEDPDKLQPGNLPITWTLTCRAAA